MSVNQACVKFSKITVKDNGFYAELSLAIEDNEKLSTIRSGIETLRNLYGWKDKDEITAFWDDNVDYRVKYKIWSDDLEIMIQAIKMYCKHHEVKIIQLR